MEPLMKKVFSLFYEFGIFILAILKKWIFPLALLLSIGGIILQRTYPEIYTLPQVYYLSILFVGFFWSAFLVYRDFFLAYQVITDSMSAEDTSKSELTISFAHGREYSYSISDPYSGQNLHMTRIQNTKGIKSRFDEKGVFFINDEVYYALAAENLEINFHIQNSGNLPYDVTSIDLDNNLNLSHLRFKNEGVFHHGKRLQCPIRLESQELIVLQARYKITTSIGSNEALFAADIQALPQSIQHKISVDTFDENKEKQSYISEIKTPTKPLIDLYVKQWRDYGQFEYLILSGHSPTGEQ
jgi:hypothetical protein